MKIDNNNPNPLTGATDSLKQTAPPVPASSDKAAGPSLPVADQLTLSPDAQLLKTATEAAHAAPEVRKDLVERMRALLNAGDIGDDAARLADAIIDDVLKDR